MGDQRLEKHPKTPNVGRMPEFIVTDSFLGPPPDSSARWSLALPLFPKMPQPKNIYGTKASAATKWPLKLTEARRSSREL